MKPITAPSDAKKAAIEARSASTTSFTSAIVPKIADEAQMRVNATNHNKMLDKTLIIIHGSKQRRVCIAAPVINSKLEIISIMPAVEFILNNKITSHRMPKAPIMMQAVRNEKQKQQD